MTEGRREGRKEGFYLSFGRRELNAHCEIIKFCLQGLANLRQRDLSERIESIGSSALIYLDDLQGGDSHGIL